MKLRKKLITVLFVLAVLLCLKWVVYLAVIVMIIIAVRAISRILTLLADYNTYHCYGNKETWRDPYSFSRNEWNTAKDDDWFYDYYILGIYGPQEDYTSDHDSK